MYSQTQGQCSDCGGEGKVIEKKTLCKTCKGAKLIKKIDKVDVPVAVGVPDGEKIVINGKGNEHPEYRAGDLIVVIKIKKHGLFTRFRNDLIMEKKVALIEALSGFAFNLDLLNEKTVTIKSDLGTIINNGSIMKIEGLGMPHHNNAMVLGDLYIKFKVQFPETITKNQVEVLQTVLPKGLLPEAMPTKFNYTMTKAPEDIFQTKMNGKES